MMWIGTTTLAEIARRSRWKVEFYTDSVRHPDVARQPRGSTANHTAHATNSPSSGSVYPWVPLAELLQERREMLHPPAFPEHGFRYIGLEHIEPHTGDLLNTACTLGGEVRSRCKIFRTGDVLYGRLRPYLNKVFYVDDNIGEGICSSEFYVLRVASDRIEPAFARLMLASDFVLPVVRDLTTGSALPRLDVDDLLSIRIPLPSLDQQIELVRFVAEQDERRRRWHRQAAAVPAAVSIAVNQALRHGQSPRMPQPTADDPKLESFPLPKEFRSANSNVGSEATK